MNQKTIFDALVAATTPVKVSTLADGSELLFLPVGGRLLGLFAPGGGETFLWVNPAFSSAESACKLFASREWRNFGGDRTWLAPEIDVFFPQFPDTSLSHVPHDLDPGHYCFVEKGSDFEFKNEFEIWLSRSKRWLSGVIVKSWKSAANPLRYEIFGDTVQYAGYTQRTELHLSEKPEPVGIWNLLQLPPGGEVLIPVCSRTQPHIYLGTVESGELEVSEHLVRYRVARPGISKIGVHAVASTGRIGYLYKSGSDVVVVVRNFFVIPSGEYVDLPWNDCGATGSPVFCAQACYVDSALGSFVELEYHTPIFADQASHCEDISQVWAFRGPESAIRSIARKLLSSDI